jgi:hypothetical protein
MKKTVFCLMLLCSIPGWPAGPDPAEYTITIHVSASRIEFVSKQDLDVSIGGKKYELVCECSAGTLLALGDYKAKLVKDQHKTTYDSIQIYEFVFTDRSTRRFEVVGTTE